MIWVFHINRTEKPWERLLMTINEPYGFVYITTNMVNGKRYIGKRKFSDGWEKYLGSGKRLKEAIKVYGRNNFVREVICFGYTDEELCRLEMDLIKFFGANFSRDYYNIHEGGIMKGKPGKESYWYGKKISREAIEKANKKRVKKVYQFDLNGNFIKSYESVTKAAEENGIKKQGISISCNDESKTCGGYFWSYKRNLCNRVYDETRNHKPQFKVAQCKKESGEIIKIFNSIKEASVMTGIDKGNISASCNNLRRNAGGYKWRKVV